MNRISGLVIANSRNSMVKKAGNVIETHEHAGDFKEW
jgi:hypothetical protein